MSKFRFSFMVLIFSLWIPPAMAYIDPGSGSAIMSAIIGFFVAIGLAVLIFNQFITLGLFDQASLVINVVGLGVILSELIGPILVRKGLIRSGECSDDE